MCRASTGRPRPTGAAGDVLGLARGESLRERRQDGLGRRLCVPVGVVESVRDRVVELGVVHASLPDGTEWYRRWAFTVRGVPGGPNRTTLSDGFLSSLGATVLPTRHLSRLTLPVPAGGDTS